VSLPFQPSLYIFDCDGTLTDTEVLNNQACADAIAACGFPQYDLEYCMTNFVGVAMSEIKRRIEMEHTTVLPDTFIPNFINLVCERMDDTLPPVPGAVAAALHIAQTTLTCVASNGERNNVIKSLKMIGLLDHFGESHVFTKGQVARGKPFPDLFLFAADAMRADPKRCVVVEDSVAGVTAGAAAGMHVIGITAVSHDKQRATELLRRAGADAVFDDWAAILDYIS